jgi:hypothetical protein
MRPQLNSGTLYSRGKSSRAETVMPCRSETLEFGFRGPGEGSGRAPSGSRGRVCLKIDSSLLALPAHSAVSSSRHGIFRRLPGRRAPAVSITASSGGLRSRSSRPARPCRRLPAEAWHVASSSRPLPPCRAAAAVGDNCTAAARRNRGVSWEVAARGLDDRAIVASGEALALEPRPVPSAAVVLPPVRSSRSWLTGCSVSARSCWCRRLGCRPRPSAGPLVPEFGMLAGHRARVVTSGEAARVCAVSQMPSLPVSRDSTPPAVPRFGPFRSPSRARGSRCESPLSRAA